MEDEPVKKEYIRAIESEMNTLKEQVSQEAIAVDLALLAAKDRHIEGSPFLQR